MSKNKSIEHNRILYCPKFTQHWRAQFSPDSVRKCVPIGTSQAAKHIGVILRLYWVEINSISLQ